MLFSYEVKTTGGEVEAGTIEADTKDEAIATLQKRKYIILKLESMEEKPVLQREIVFFERIPQKELVLFSRQFSVLISAKIPLVQALRVTAAQTENEYLKKKIFEITSDVEGGLALSKALEKHPSLFSSFFISMVSSAEYSGKLQQTLEYLADYIDRDYTLRVKVRNALVYPAFVLVVLVAVGIIMMVWVLPRIVGVLTETGVELPFATRLIIGTLNFFEKWWWVVVFGGLVALGLFIQFIFTPKGRAWWDKGKLDFPIFGTLLRKLALTRMTGNLSMLIAAGVPIMQSLKISGEVSGNVFYKSILDKTEAKVRSGNTISSVFNEEPEIPPMVTQMVHVGEQTGKLDYTLGEVARFYEREVNNLVDNLVELILPVVVVILGIVVGIFVIGIIAPIYQIAQTI